MRKGRGDDRKDRLFVRSKIPNLVKYVPTGRYYARAKLGGTQVYESLKTFDYEVAELRLAKFMDQMRKRRAKRVKRPKTGTFKELFDDYEQRIEVDSDLAESSKKAKRYALKRLKATWPDLANIRPSRLSVDAVVKWAKKLKSEGTNFTAPGAKIARKGNSSSTVNKTIQALSRIMDLAVAKGLAADNIVRQNVKTEKLRAKDSAKIGDIPSKEEFDKILNYLSSLSGGSPFVFGAKIIAYTGCRIGEARKLRWKHVDFVSGMLHIPGRKTDAADRKIPMANQLVKLFKTEFQKVEKIGKLDTREVKIMPVSTLNKRLKAACEALGIGYFTNHDIRDYYATTALEAGIPVHTVAAWLGHVDGGALLLKRYAHLRDRHSAEQAKKLNF